jgi:hypothetical protein
MTAVRQIGLATLGGVAPAAGGVLFKRRVARGVDRLFAASRHVRPTVRTEADRRFNGIRIPVAGEAVWKLRCDDLPSIQARITRIEYNRPAPY